MTARGNDLEFDEPELELVDEDTHRLVSAWWIRFRGGDYCVPRGLETDGASIPLFLQFLCGNPNRKPRLYAAIVHDWMYSGMSDDCRSCADAFYRDMQIALGIPAWRAWVEWCALRVFGGPHWAGDPDLND